MKCWNCLKEIPEAAKWCNFCESSQNYRPTGSAKELEVASEVLDPAAIMELKIMAASAETFEEFEAMVFSGDCPACGSSKTEDCENDPEINSILFSRCKECGVVYCPDCGRIYNKGVETATDNDCPTCGNQEEEEMEFDEDETDEETDAFTIEEREIIVRGLAKMLGVDRPLESWSPACPACSSPETATCEDTPGINNLFVLECKKCRTRFCAECENVYDGGRPIKLEEHCRNCGSENFNYVPTGGEKTIPESIRVPMKLDAIIHCSDCGADFCICCGRRLLK